VFLSLVVAVALRFRRTWTVVNTDTERHSHRVKELVPEWQATKWKRKIFLFWIFSAVRCQPLRVPNNGRIRPASCSSGATYSQTCTFICYDGYNVNGANDVRCLANRTWSDSVPTCDRGMCKLWNDYIVL
jgi:hypothetical protein